MLGDQLKVGHAETLMDPGHGKSDVGESTCQRDEDVVNHGDLLI